MIRWVFRLAMVLMTATGGSGTAIAQADLLSPERVSASVDLRIIASDAERSWLEGGFGKTRFGDGEADLTAALAEATLVWTPRFSERLTGVASIEIQDGQDDLVDLGEAYLSWRTPPGARARLSGRAGLYFPEISLEHDGPEWAVADTLTPSAINSWVAEELKVVGAEATARFDLAGGSAAVTVGGFGFGDKAGTLLALRGWALHDRKATASTVWPLSPIGNGGIVRAAPSTTALLEVDDRIGIYGRLEWNPDATLSISLFAYDSRGDRVSRVRQEGAWDTRFLAAAAEWSLGTRTRARGQFLLGETAVGSGLPGTFTVRADYSAGFVSVSREFARSTITARIDRFSVSDTFSSNADNNDESGRAATVAYRWDFDAGADLTAEAVVIDSARPSRARLGEASAQGDVQLQLAYRRRF